jgi:hypothetical protein
VNRRLLFRAGLSVLFILIIQLEASAQSLPAGQISHYRQELADCQNVVVRWQHQADLEIALTLAVIVFGALITVLQASTKSWSKFVTVVLGAAVTVFTGVNAKIFSVDYRVLQQSAIDAQALIEQLTTIVERLAVSSSAVDTNGLEGEWLRTISEFRTLEKSVLTGHSAAAILTLQEVYAQAQPLSPPWIQSPPTDNSNLYVVGEGKDSSLTAAQQKSMENAIDKAVDQVGSQGNVDRTRLRKFISSFSTVQTTWFVWNPNIGQYDYFSLLRLSKEIYSVSFGGTPESQRV